MVTEIDNDQEPSGLRDGALCGAAGQGVTQAKGPERGSRIAARAPR